MAPRSASVSKAGCRSIALLAALLLLPGCEFGDRLGREWNALLTVLQGGRSPLAKPTASPSPSVQPSPSVAVPSRTKVNAELLREIFLVVHLREPKDRAGFGTLLDTLDQGGSYEGIYNGFTHSSDYRKLEITYTGATPEAVAAFAEELAVLELEMPVPTEFTPAAAKAMPVPVRPTGIDPDAPVPEPTLVTFEPKASPSPAAKVDPAALAARYRTVFATASIFTLKRILGEEALKALHYMDRAKLPDWYGKWAARLAHKKVDYGIPLRSNPDEQFHASWARSVSEDQLKWEVLNRLHRLLNEANRKQP